METIVELTRTPERDPRSLTYADLTGGIEPVAIFRYDTVWLVYFDQVLGENQITNVRARAQGSEREDELRNDVIAQAPNIELIRNSTGTLTAAQLSDAVRALANATFAVGLLTLDQTGNSSDGA